MAIGDTELAWQGFFMDYEIARNHRFPQRLISTSIAAPNPLLDEMLPSLLFVNLCSIFDEALTEYADSKSLNIPSKNQKTLNGKIEFFNSQDLILEKAALDWLRAERNRVAHKSQSRIDWNQLAALIDDIEKEIQNLGLVTARPDFEIYGECSEFVDTGKPGIIGERTYKYGLKNRATGRSVYETSWKEKLHTFSE